MLSLIIPVKELNNYLFNTICTYKYTINHEYEIIIIYDDISEYYKEKYTSYFRNDDTVILIENPLKGRINALNYGYAISKGSIIKCIDDDDILLEKYFDNLSFMKNYSAHCHNATLINDKNDVIGNYTFEKNILFKNYKYVLSNLKSPPRWIWSFDREIGDLIFPIPPKLFAEDVWFSLIIKKNCSNIFHINESAYLYRQHEGGEWGGIKNFSSEVMVRRAEWNLSMITILLENKSHLEIESEAILSNIVNYYKVLLARRNMFNIICASTSMLLKVKLLLIMYLPNVASMILSLKWFINKIVIEFRSKKTSYN